MCNNHTNEAIQWGPQSYKDRYTQLLFEKCIGGWGLSVGLGVGILYFVQRFFSPGIDFVHVVGLTIWILAVLLLAARLSLVNDRIERTERFFGFYERRYEVRHQTYCLWWVHCAALHGFRRTKAK